MTFYFKEQLSEIFIVAFHIISISSVKYTLTVYQVNNYVNYNPDRSFKEATSPIRYIAS